MLSDNIFRNVAQYLLIKSRNFPFRTCMKQNQKQKKAQPLRAELCNFDLEISLAITNGICSYCSNYLWMKISLK